ncbi:protein O-glucosyltransferase 1-like [Olea europaea var. sylvestris]|uniref:protein O-glucosyltransferase 1-like n=1 Tax=Olea europaea var. sylvestris TaxID=158386 RepID=UPI000C1CD11E|nr:protein O-glucosyltransferase 1-like [Olea europaea var. sylvestris]
MKGNSEEKLMKTYWIRPVFQRHSFGSKWRLMKKKASSKSTLLVYSFFLLALLFLAAWIDLAKYAGNTSQKALQIFSRTPSNPNLEFPLDCSIWNQTNTCPKNYPTSYKLSNPNSSLNPKCPEFFRWIPEDLRPWRETGITMEMVEKARKTAHFRLVISDGKIYVEKFRQSIQTRALFTLWGIVQLMRRYPGKLPDLELMFDCNDRPVIQAKHYRQPDSGPPPLFRYCSDWKSLDIVFPDWSFWGWPELNIKPWEILKEDLQEGNGRIKWNERKPNAYWKGNTDVSLARQDLVKCNGSKLNARIDKVEWKHEMEHGFKTADLASQCNYRYKIYIEGVSWSVSEKYILACDSMSLMINPHYYDFFTRSLLPTIHYWPINKTEKCKSIKFAVEWGNKHMNKAQEIGQTGSKYIQEQLRMQYVYDYMFHLLNEYSKLLKYKPTVPKGAAEVCSETMVCSVEGLQKKFRIDSMVKNPADSSPCTFPPSYNRAELEDFLEMKDNLTKQVKILEESESIGNPTIKI